MMLSRNIEFVDSIDSLTERKIMAMSARARNTRKVMKLEHSDIVNYRLIDSDGTRRMFSIILHWS